MQYPFLNQNTPFFKGFHSRWNATRWNVFWLSPVCRSFAYSTGYVVARNNGVANDAWDLDMYAMHAWLRPLPGGSGPQAGKNTWCVEGSKSTRFKVFRISTSTFSYTTQTTHQTGGRNGSVSNKMMVAIIYTRRVGHLFHLCPTLNVCLWSAVHDDVGCCTCAVAHLPYPFPFTYPQQHDATILICENGSASQSIT